MTDISALYAGPTVPRVPASNSPRRPILRGSTVGAVDRDRVSDRIVTDPSDDRLMTRHATINTHTSNTHTSRPVWRLFIGPLAVGSLATTACGTGSTAQPAIDPVPVADQVPAADNEHDIVPVGKNPSGPRSALLDGAEFATAVDAAIDAHHSAVTSTPSVLLDGAEFARAVEAAIAAHSADRGAPG